MPKPVSLGTQEVYIQPNSLLHNAPVELQGILKLVVSVKKLESNRFGGVESTKEVQGIPRRLSTREKYQKELKSEAINLQVICTDPKLKDAPEDDWIYDVKPIVFHRFDRAQEETLARHRHQHCFICRKHYPIGSRPPMNEASHMTRGGRQKEEFWKESPADLCKSSSKEHFNLPNFCMEKLFYPEIDDDGARIPDGTIGLHTYDLNKWPLGYEDLLPNPRVAPFDRQLLQKLERKKYLTFPYKLAATKQRSHEPNLTFPFALWEAKRAGGTDDLLSATIQNAPKVKQLLKFQIDVARKSEISWKPLVWKFVNIGSQWHVYGCYQEESRAKKGSYLAILCQLWSGDCTDENEALQLLYIVDIIALWGEHCYKPFAGACIQRLAAELNDEKPPAEDLLLVHQLSIDDATFPSLFSERDATVQDCSLVQARREINRRPSQKRTAFRNGRDRDSLPDIGTLSLSTNSGLSNPANDDSILPLEPSSNTYIIPERDCYLWLLNRAKQNTDILVIRIKADGAVSKPLIFFAGAEWDHDQFENLVQEEKGRKPLGLSTNFISSQTGTPYIRRCIRLSPGYFRDPQLQFCAIVPLDRNEYVAQLESAKTKATIFKGLESKLGIEALLEAAEVANGRVCECQAAYNEHTPPLVLCDNLKCAVGWYHQKCVSLPKGFESKVWFCDECKSNPTERKLGHVKVIKANKSADQKLLQASDARIHRAKTFFDAWEAHNLPSRKRIARWFDQISCRIEIDVDNIHDTVSCVTNKNDDDSECWAIQKSDPKLTMPIKSLNLGNFTK